jgi:hypothetical protein
MSDRDFGSLHTYLDADEKNYETMVAQQNANLSSSELVLSQEIRRQEEDDILRENVDSGFLDGDFGRDAQEDFTFQQNANEFQIVNKPIFHLNGWVIPLEYTDTNTDGQNIISLPDAPTSSGELGVDFVWLEAWRGLIESNPSTTRKPAADKVYRHGNWLSPSNTWLDDEMKDNPVSQQTGDETSIRVQVQYRVRTARLDANDSYDGFSDANVQAQGPNGSPTSQSFTHAPDASVIDSDDRGMWIAGDETGNANAVSGTADGFVYALPICLVYRRNSAGFNASSNGNGGINEVESATPSDRPDGLFSDQVVEGDIQDLRHGVTLQGRDWNQVLDKSLHLLLDNELKTWAMDSSQTQWYVGGNNDTAGTEMFMADDIVPDGVDRSNGNTIRNPDGICRVFSDRPYVQKHVEIYETNSDWAQGDTLTLDLRDQPGAKNIQDELPDGAEITDVTGVHLDDSDGSNGYIDLTNQTVVSGLNSLNATVTFPNPFGISSQRDMWVEWEITYPAGSGLSQHPKSVPSNFEANFNPSTEFENAIGTTLNTSDDVLQYADISYEEPHREGRIEIRESSSKTITVYAKDDTTVVIPEHPYVDGVDPNNTITVEEGGNPVGISGVNERTINLSSTLAANDAQVDVIYQALLPLPKNTETTLYYRTPAVQALPADVLPSSLDVDVIHAPDSLYAVTSSTGSHDTCYPWVYPSHQLPVSVDAEYRGEQDLSAPADITLDNYDVDTGLIELSNHVPLPSLSDMTFSSPQLARSVQEESVDHYQGTALGQFEPFMSGESFSSPVPHKTFYPLLVQLNEDTDVAQEGSILLAIFNQYQFVDDAGQESGNTLKNDIDVNANKGCISLYKVKGNFFSSKG